MPAVDSPAPVLPVEVSGKFAFEWDTTRFEVDPKVGGRITRFSLGGRDVLTGPAVHAECYGSTFWTSPQSAWGWPPPPAMDVGAYEVSRDGEALLLTSAEVAFGAQRCRVSKRFSADRARGAVDIRYSVTNLAPEALVLAPWEISRSAVNGLTFFPAGRVYDNSNLRAEERGGVFWLDFAQSYPGSSVKLFADGARGWIAHVDGDLVFIKTFRDVPESAQLPGEGEIEVYFCSQYIEIEQQGEKAELARGASLDWDVRWYLREKPAGLSASPGSAELVTFVESVIAS